MACGAKEYEGRPGVQIQTGSKKMEKKIGWIEPRIVQNDQSRCENIEYSVCCGNGNSNGNGM